MTKIPADMHKWSANFAWQMIAFAIVMFLMAGLMLTGVWFMRANFLANPARMLVPIIGVIFAAIVLVSTAFMCVKISISTRKHDAKMKELEKNRTPLTLSKLREELQPEKQAQTRSTLLALLRSSPMMRDSMEASMSRLVDRYRADLGSTPEVEAELARFEEFNKSLLEELKSLS